MSKEVRKILARGLTKSDIGSVIEYNDQSGLRRTVRIDDVNYVSNTNTRISFRDVAFLPNDLEIAIID